MNSKMLRESHIILMTLMMTAFVCCQSEVRNYAILDFESIDKIFMQYPNEEFTKTDLSSEEVRLVQEILVKEMDDFNQREIDRLRRIGADTIESIKYDLYIGPIDEYWCQYVPMSNSTGDKNVFVNCFCDEPHDDSWKYTIVDYMDGGRCSFRMRILLNKKKGVHMKVNGTAAIDNGQIPLLLQFA